MAVTVSSWRMRSVRGEGVRVVKRWRGEEGKRRRGWKRWKRKGGVWVLAVGRASKYWFEWEVLKGMEGGREGEREGKVDEGWVCTVMCAVYECCQWCMNVVSDACMCV